MPVLRLDKFFSQQEILSRQEVRTAVRLGGIKINGKTAVAPDQKVNTEKDEIVYNNEKIDFKEHIYLMLNKPKGVVSATDDKINKTVLDLVPEKLYRSGLFPAGRLDKDSEGFVLLTDDGAFAHKILSPKNHISKTYIVTLEGRPTEEGLERIRKGITLADGTVCRGADVKILDDSCTPQVEIVLVEGKYHQIKRMFGVLKLPVTALKRIKMGELALYESLAPGECCEILDKDINKISGK